MKNKYHYDDIIVNIFNEAFVETYKNHDKNTNLLVIDDLIKNINIEFVEKLIFGIAIDHSFEIALDIIKCLPKEHILTNPIKTIEIAVNIWNSNNCRYDNSILAYLYEIGVPEYEIQDYIKKKPNGIVKKNILIGVNKYYPNIKC